MEREVLDVLRYMYWEVCTTFWLNYVCYLFCVHKGPNKGKNLGRLFSMVELGSQSLINTGYFQGRKTRVRPRYHLSYWLFPLKYAGGAARRVLRRRYLHCQVHSVHRIHAAMTNLAFNGKVFIAQKFFCSQIEAAVNSSLLYLQPFP